MTESVDVMRQVAEQIGPALEDVDLSAFGDLLDPAVHWGPAGEASPACHNRDQVLSWYRRGKEAGTRAEVVEIAVSDDHLIVGLEVRNTANPEGERNLRWQVLTVVNGRVANIVGFERRADATTYAEAR